MTSCKKQMALTRTFSRRSFAPVILALVGVLAIAGCRGAGKGGSSSTFFIEALKISDTSITCEDPHGAMVKAGEACRSKSGKSGKRAMNSWGFPIKREYTFSACLKDSSQLATVMDQPFDVIDEAGNRRPVATDQRGCFEWTETHQFDYFAPEAFVVIKRQIAATGGHNGVETIEVAVNPWKPGAIADLRYATPEGITREKPEPTGFVARTVAGRPADAYLDLKSVGFQYLGMDDSAFEINPQLTLTIAHKYRIRLNPVVYRQTLDKPWTSESPNVGQMRLTIALMREGRNSKVEPEQFVTSWSGIVTMESGVITQDITLKFPDISAVASRMRAFVTLEPIVESTALSAVTLSAPFGPLPSSSTMSLVPDQIDAIDVLKRVEHHESNLMTKKLNPIKLFAAVSGFREVTPEQWNAKSVNDSAAKAVTFELAEKILAKKADEREARAFARRLCYEMYATDVSASADRRAPAAEERKWSWGRRNKSTSPSLSSCLSAPQNALRMDRRELVERLNSPKPKRVGLYQAETITVQSNFAESTVNGRTDKWTKFGWGVDGSFGLSFSPMSEGSLMTWLVGLLSPVVPKISVGANMKMGYGQEWFRTYSRQRTTSVTHSVGRVLAVEGITFDVDAVVKPCMIVGALNGSNPADGQDAANMEGGLFFCMRQSQPKVAREAYYFVSQNASSSSPIVDSGSALEVPFRMFIRGAGTYQSFKQTVSDANVELVLESAGEEENSVEGESKNEMSFTKAVEFRMTQDFPGMLSVVPESKCSSCQ